jgi:hypothetical protein
LNKNGLNDSALEDFDFDHPFFRFDHGHNVSALHRIAGPHAPLDKGAGLHVGAE